MTGIFWFVYLNPVFETKKNFFKNSQEVTSASKKEETKTFVYEEIAGNFLKTLINRPHQQCSNLICFTSFNIIHYFAIQGSKEKFLNEASFVV